MALSFEIVERDEYLLCAVSGEHDTIQEYMGVVSAVLKHCRNSHYLRAIIDYRLVTIYPEPADRIALLEALAKLYSTYDILDGSPIRLAFLTNTESYDYNETPKAVANYMKLDLMRTSDIGEAEAWLKRDDSLEE